MMKRLLLPLLLMAGVYAYAQQNATTFILVRHAEKASDGSKDPDLTDEGKARAQALIKLLKEVNVDAIFSTGFKRTQNTVAPLAAHKGIAVQAYDPKKPEPIDAMLSKYPGGTIVVCGHSNTIPWTANYLLEKEQFKDFEDSDFDNVLLVTVTEKGNAKAIWITY